MMDASAHAKRGVKIRRVLPKDRIMENISVMESGRVEPIRVSFAQNTSRAAKAG